MANAERLPTYRVHAARPTVSVTASVPSPAWLVRLLAVAMAPAMVIIMGIDLRLRGSEDILTHGIVDETAHILTALVIFAAIRAAGFEVNWLMAAFGAVVADADYLLIHEGLMDQVGDSSRGILHTLGPALAVCAVGLLVPPARVFFLSLGIGMLTHVFRDSATAETPLLWPLVDHAWHLRYSAYLAILIGFTIITTGIVALGGKPLRR